MIAARGLALLLVAIGLFAVAETWWRMPLGALSAPGPGLVPFILGAVLVVLSAATLLEPAGGPPEAVDRRRPVLVAALLVLYPLLLPHLGFGVTTAVVLLLLGRAITPAGLGRLALFALLSAALAIGLFRQVLAVPLPRGPWGF